VEEFSDQRTHEESIGKGRVEEKTYCEHRVVDTTGGGQNPGNSENSSGYEFLSCSWLNPKFYKRLIVVLV